MRKGLDKERIRCGVEMLGDLMDIEEIEVKAITMCFLILLEKLRMQWKRDCVMEGYDRNRRGIASSIHLVFCIG
jgi:hypothetical protein